MFLEILQNSQKNTCARVSFLIKKETLAQVFSCELCKISKNTSFTAHLRTTASTDKASSLQVIILILSKIGRIPNFSSNELAKKLQLTIILGNVVNKPSQALKFSEMFSIGRYLKQVDVAT